MIIKGKIVKGMGIAGDLGFPTVNIEYGGLERGVFAARVKYRGVEYAAAVNVGPKPTFDIDKVFVEAHLIEVEGFEAVEGSEIKIELVEKVRDVKKFKDGAELSRQISSDIEIVRDLL
jgi:riboflavin kinase / FMN adenylyltransferase